MAGDLVGEMRIGEVLKQARRRAGLDIRTVEERTKIRIKYLRALENEEWEALPNPAYAKGFLRTYGNLLGLDGDALADAFRRQVERGRSEIAYPLGEQVLGARRPLGAGPSRPWLPWLIGAVLLIAGALLAIGLLGEDEGDEAEKRRPAAAKQDDGKGRDRGPAAAGETVTLGLSIRDSVEICLLGGGGQPLIDGQALNAGTEESYERRRFELRFPRGFDNEQFRLTLHGEPRRLQEISGPAAFAIEAPRRVSTLKPPGEQCP